MLQKIGEDDELLQSLQDLLLSSSRDENVDDVMKLTKAYHNYKRKYVKHLSFNSTEENLSKVIPTDQSLSNLFQPRRWSMPRCRQCISTLTRLHMMRLRRMRR